MTLKDPVLSQSCDAFRILARRSRASTKCWVGMSRQDAILCGESAAISPRAPISKNNNVCNIIVLKDGYGNHKNIMRYIYAARLGDKNSVSTCNVNTRIQQERLHPPYCELADYHALLSGVVFYVAAFVLACYFHHIHESFSDNNFRNIILTSEGKGSIRFFFCRIGFKV